VDQYLLSFQKFFGVQIFTLRGFQDSRSLLLAAIVAVISLSFHEFAHAWVALKNGDSTAKMQGRVTINPASHLDVLGFLAFVFAGIGFAKPVPINQNNFNNRKKGIFCVAIAGITANLILAILGAFFYVMFFYLYLKSDGQNEKVYQLFIDFFGLFATMNVSLIFFNLLPIHPLDGFRVFESFANYNNRFVKYMRNYGQYILLGLILISLIVNSVSAMPQYFDVLGTYLKFFGLNLVQLFVSLFGLLFYGQWSFVLWTP
jgi:Zn-dependent protease